MIKQELTIINKLGLHARAAAKFVSHASRYQSQIELHLKNRIVNGKSIMGVMMLAASKGTALELVVFGEDETEASNDLTSLINDRFGEEE